ncbi:MAG: ComEC/Rec2 family competence protein [Pseudomonadota bacterium]
MTITTGNDRPVTDPNNGIFGALLAEQDRWALWAPVFVGAGIVLYFTLPAEPDLLTATMPAFAALLIRCVWRRGVIAMVVSGVALAVTFGLCVAKLRTEFVRAPILERKLNNVVVTGFVRRIEQRPSGGPRVTLRVTGFSERVRADWPHRVRVRFLRPVAGVLAGSHIRVRASLAPPPRPALPGGYDFARRAFFQGLGAVGYTFALPETVPAPEPLPWQLHIAAEIEQLRQRIGQRVQAVLPGDRGALANALITGERGGIPETINDAFRDSGLLHILSISGLHMAVMGGFVFVVVRFLLALFPAIALRYPIKKWAAGAAMIAAFGYLMISGGALATVRSFLMISIAFAAIMLDRQAISLRNVALAALAMLVVMPEGLLDPGFQMSFAAVVALVAAYEAIRDRRRARPPDVQRGAVIGLALVFGGIILTTLVASLAVAPIAVYHFHRSQQFAVLANLVAVPVTNFILMPAAFLTLLALPFELERWPLIVMGWALDILVWVAHAVAGLPGAVTPVPAIPTLAFALCVIGGCWLVIWRRRWRFAGLAAIAIGLALTPLRNAPDILIGAEGRLVAYRNPDGRLTAIGRGGTFALSRWLQADGDGRDTKTVLKGINRRCDTVGCIGRTHGRTIALSRYPSSLRDDCVRADILVLTYRKPHDCAGGRIMIDRTDLRIGGPHVVFIEPDTTARVFSVDDVRGKRPWVLSPRTRLTRKRQRPATAKPTPPSGQ